MPDKFETIARALFPDDYHDGTDCRAEVGNEVAPCRHCAYRREEWLKRVASVKAAIEAVPAPADPLRDAAGDMLAALREFVGAVDAGTKFADLSVLQAAHAAIAKAEGRS